MEDTDAISEPSVWWGTFTVAADTGGRWEVGPTTLWLYRTPREWRVLHRAPTNPSTTDPMSNRSGATVPVEPDEIDEVLSPDAQGITTTRHTFRKTGDQITLRPALADRRVVSRPDHPIQVPTKEAVTLYLSTPLWIQIVLPDSDQKIQELPSHRMSDTWFGNTTTNGEFCYASRMSGRLELERVPRRLHRAVTPLKIANKGEEPLLLERVQLPVPYLSLYMTSQDDLWTDTVQMTRKPGTQGADIQIKSGPPAHAGDARLLQPPRNEAKTGLFTSGFGAFGSLFGV